MNYATLQAALVLWVAALTGIDAKAIVWENEIRVQSPGVLIVLSWVSTAPVGIEDTRWENTGDAAPALNMEPVVVGQRALVLQLSIESVLTTPDAPNARVVAEQFRTRVRAPSSLTRLTDAQVGLQSVGAVQQADYRVDQRWRNRCIVEVRLNATTFFRDTEGAAPSMESVLVSSDLQSLNGTDSPVQLADEVMP